MKACWLAAIAITLSAVAQAGTDAITYKGMALGATQAEFAAQFPDFACSGSMCSYDADKCSGRFAGPADGVYEARKRACSDRNSLGGSFVEYATAHFRDGKLSMVSFSMPTVQADNLMSSAQERYGAPKSVDDTVFRTKGGATFPNLSKSWEVGGISLSVTRNSGRMGSGSALLVSLEELKLAAEERRSGIKKGASDF